MLLTSEWTFFLPIGLLILKLIRFLSETLTWSIFTSLSSDDGSLLSTGLDFFFNFFFAFLADFFRFFAFFLDSYKKMRDPLLILH